MILYLKIQVQIHCNNGLNRLTPCQPRIAQITRIKEKIFGSSLIPRFMLQSLEFHSPTLPLALSFFPVSPFQFFLYWKACWTTKRAAPILSPSHFPIFSSSHSQSQFSTLSSQFSVLNSQLSTFQLTGFESKILSPSTSPLLITTNFSLWLPHSTFLVFTPLNSLR